MRDQVHRAIAVVGVGAVLPDAPGAKAFWENVATGRYSITDTPPDRWDPALYYDPDPKAPDKTYSKIGGWVRDFDWAPLKWKLPIPPKVAEAMDRRQEIETGRAVPGTGFEEEPLHVDAEVQRTPVERAEGKPTHGVTTTVSLGDQVSRTAAPSGITSPVRFCTKTFKVSPPQSTR